MFLYCPSSKYNALDNLINIIPELRINMTSNLDDYGISGVTIDPELLLF